MALSQRNTIREPIIASISHLLDFPDDASEFSEKEWLLVEALTYTVDNDHEFYWLGEFFKNPTKYLLNLEQKVPLLTVGQVQDEMLDYIFECLTNSPHALTYWNRDTIIETLSDKSRNSPYVSQQAQVPVDSGTNIWQLPELTECIYTQTMYIRADDEYPEYDKAAYFRVYVTTPDGTETKYLKSETLRSNFKNDSEENEYIEKVLERTAIKAKRQAAKIAIYYLSSQLDFLEDLIDIILDENSIPVQTVLTHSYWFDLLNQEIIGVNDIYDVSKDAATSLTNSSVISLYKNKIISLEMAKKISADCLLLIKNPVYLSLIYNGSLSIESASNVTNRRANFLIHPHVTNLIKLEKITFKQVKYLPFHLNEFFKDYDYMTYFMNHKINWSIFEKIPNGKHVILFGKPIAHLIFNKIISFSDFNMHAKKYDDHHTIIHDIMMEAFVNRLFALYLQEPYLITCNGSSNIDSINTIISDLSTQDLGDLNIFKNRLVREILLMLKSDFEIKIEALMQGDERIQTYQRFIDIIEDKKDESWAITFNKACVLAVEIRLSIRQQELTSPEAQNTVSASSSNTTIFLRKRKVMTPDTDIKNLCDAMISFSKINVETPSLNLRSSLTLK